MSGYILMLFGAVFIIRGLMRVYRPAASSMYKAWKLKYDSEPNADYKRMVSTSGWVYVVLGSVLLVFGTLILLE